MLVSGGRNFFPQGNAEFGSLDKIWNCVALCVMSQVNVNDAILRVIRNDIVNPFHGAFTKDFKYLELLINSEELQEMASELSTANGEYNWNMKAPAILSNFESYKRYEKELLFSGFLSYLNTVNDKMGQLIGKNENAVSYILKEYDVNAEMQKYTQHVLALEIRAAPVHTKKASHADKSHHHAAPPPPPPQKSHTNSSIGTKEKRKSKLRSRVGSILGRKKKASAASVHTAETIQEDELVVSVPSRQNTQFSTRELISRPSAPITSSVPHQSNIAQNSKSGGDSSDRNVVSAGATGAAGAAGAIVGGGVVAAHAAMESRSASRPNTIDAQPLAPTTAQHGENYSITGAPSRPQGHAGTADLPEPSLPDEDANIVKYESSGEESDVPTDVNGRRLSMLQAHDLGQAPKFDSELDIRSRNTLSGKYSFDFGDEQGRLSEAPAPIRENVSTEETAPSAAPAPIEKHALPAPPPPPPSRKVQNSESRVPSSTFANLPNARELIIQPHMTGDRMSLVSQTTGNSMFKQNHFKHFDAEAATREGLNVSVAEIINVSYHDGDVSKAQILGEIAFNFNSQSSPPKLLAVNIPTKFTKFLLNEEVLRQSSDSGFDLRVPPVAGKTLGGVKYMRSISAHEVPILVKQVWKFEPHQASLIVKVLLNPALKSPLTLDNFVLAASLSLVVASTSAQSKPEGSFNKDNNRITWRQESLKLTPDAPEAKFIARIMTNGQALELPSGVQVKFVVSDSSVSFVEVLNEDGNSFPTINSLSSGNFTSHTN